MRQELGPGNGVTLGGRTWLALCIVLVGWLGVMGPVHAQSADTSSVAALPDPLTPEAITQLVSRLSDTEVRALLLDELGARSVTDAAVVPHPRAMQLLETAGVTAAHMLAAVQETPATVAAITTQIRDATAAIGAGGTWAFLAMLLATGLAALSANRAWHWLFTGRRVLTDGSAFAVFATGLSASLPGKLAAAGVGGLVAFLAVQAVLAALPGVSGAEAVGTIILRIVVVPLVGAAVLDAILAPRNHMVRPVALDDRTAAYLFRSLLGVLILFCAALTLRIFTAPDMQRSVAFWVNLAVFFWLAIIILQTREGLSDIIRGSTEALTSFERGLASAYPWLALVAILVTWAASVVQTSLRTGPVEQRGQHLLSLAIVLAVPLLDAAIRSTLRRYAKPMQGDGLVAEQAYAASLRSYKRMARVVALGIMIAVSTALWDVSLADVASAELGEQFAAHLVRATMICLFGYLIWEITRLVINRRLAREQTQARVAIAQDDIEGQGNEPVSSRLATLLPPVSWTLQAVIVTLTALTALANIGIDITPLLAGAGVAGIAIGFGAQKLVSDIVSGIFFLFDDAFRLNEYIDAGGTVGTVERISLRSLRLRDDNGPLYCIPYSEVSRVTNFGRDWGIMKLKFTVPFDTDPETVRKIFKRIGQDMLQVPELAACFIEPFKSQGVKDFNDTGMVVRGKFKFKPGAQFAIRKEIYHRVQKAFAENGIEFARKEVRVLMDGEASQSMSRDRATAAAAIHAVEGTKPVG